MEKTREQERREYEVAKAELHESELKIAHSRGQITEIINSIRTDPEIVAAVAEQAKITGEDAETIMDALVEKQRAKYLPEPASGQTRDDAPVEPAVAKFRSMLG